METLYLEANLPISARCFAEYLTYLDLPVCFSSNFFNSVLDRGQTNDIIIVVIQHRHDFRWFELGCEVLFNSFGHFVFAATQMLSFHESEKKNEHLRKVPFPTDKCGCHRDILIYDANPLKANLAYKIHSKSY